MKSRPSCTLEPFSPVMPPQDSEQYRWFERELMERGPLEWPELRLSLDATPFAAQARELVDGAEVDIPPDIEELRGALAQTARALALKEPMHLLGRGP